MSRLPVTESSKEFKVVAPSSSVATVRNRLISWDSTVQELTEPFAVVPSSKSEIILRSLRFVIKKTKFTLAALVKLPYTLFKLGYEIAKLVARGLSSTRRSILSK
jgi:hypothetical protein